MATTEGSTRQELIEIAALIDANLVSKAQERLGALIRQLPRDSLELISPDLRTLVERFQKQRRRDLMQLLDGALARRSRTVTAVRTGSLEGVAVKSRPHEPARAHRYSLRLAELRDRHIFQWSTFYRETVGYIFKDLQTANYGAETWQDELDQIASAFTQHSQEIFERGYQFVTSGGLPEEIAIVKSLNGLQRFLYLVINLFLEARETIQSQRSARQTWDITSSMLLGILRGYGSATFGERKGWEFLLQYRRGWMPAVGFMTGTGALSLFQEAPPHPRLAIIFSAIVPTLLALDQFSNRQRASDSLLPRLSRIPVGDPARLDITLGPFELIRGRDITLSCFFEEVIHDEWSLREAISLKAAAVIGTFSDSAKELADSDAATIVVEAGEVGLDPGHARNLAELIRARLDSAARATTAQTAGQLLTRNYAREFPLEDPDTRRMYMVERHSVKELLQQFEQGTGVHLWCSVRRSGKTTAASNMADMSGRSVVVFQTMDHQPHQPELNIFERRMIEALEASSPLAHDFFSKVVDDCALATISVSARQRKIVLVIDEYESLFGTLQAMTNSNPDLRFLVALPLLSQMVSFASRNLLILMGQRPDAHYILASQNQLSPLARQYGFPLFAHQRGGSDSEFVQFLRRVLTQNLPFGPDFADAVYEETGGHPYLTVNMMVDLCDWLIENEAKATELALDAATLNAFIQDRLVPTTLQRNPHYSFFQTMLSEYLGEAARRQEPWFHAVAMILRQIAVRHPRALGCSLVSFASIAEPLREIVRMTPNQLLASASMANFLRTKSGQVVPAIRLMARLAGCAVPGNG